MKMPWPFSLILLPAFLCLDFFCYAQYIHFDAVTPNMGANTYDVMGMTQDMQGYLWLATTDGLYRYDGYQYAVYQHQALNSNSPAAAKIECIAADKTGHIWMAPFCMGIDRLNAATGTFTHFRHYANDTASLISDSVWAIMEDHEGMVWIGTQAGLEKFDPKTNQFIHFVNSQSDPTSLSFNEVRVLYEDKEGNIWVGTGGPFVSETPNDGGLNKLDKKTGKFTRYLHNETDQHSLIDGRVRAIFEDSRGNFWIGTAGDGLHTMDRAKGTFERHLYDPLHPDRLSRPPIKKSFPWAADHISFITEDHRGNIWIGTFEGGINVYDPLTQKIVYYGDGKNSKEKLPYNHFWTAYKTRDNTIWISTWENKFYKIKPWHTTPPHTYIGKTVIYFAEDDAHSLWITTLKGLVHKTTDGKEEHFLISKDSASPANQLFYIEKDGNLFWLTTNNGLYLFDPVSKIFTHYPHRASIANSLSSDTVTTLQKNTDNTLWVATANGLDLMDTKTGACTHFRNSVNDTGSISNNMVISISTDRNQNVWVCTDKGANRLDKKTGTFKRYLTQATVLRILEDKGGNLWATTEAGLFKYHRDIDNFLIFTDESMIITPELIFWITEDHAQNLWLITNKGIIRLNKERNSATFYGKNQSVNVTDPVPAGYTRQNGEVLFGGDSGYYHFQTTQLQQYISAPIVIIHKFLLNNISVQPTPAGILSLPLLQTKEISLNHTQNNFAFQFNNVDFSSEHEDTRLLYMLQNYDNTWRKSGEEKTAYYFNLPPGKYIFRVKALNAAGVAAEKSITVIISPPWWKTWWAYSLAVVILAGLVYAVYRNRTNQIKRKQAAQINTMVAAQEGERKRISRDLHDDVGTKLSALKLFLSSLHEKAAFTNNEEIKSLAASSEQFITEVMQDVRQLLLNLSPAVLEEFGYATAVEGLVNKINQTRQIQFNLVMFGMKARLQKDYELALYRITQELINNVLKHAEAKNVSLQIGQRDEKIVLMIEDDGKGFDVNAHKNGYGLQNLQARTEMMNGTMVIDSQPGKGTSVLIEIPYNFN